MRDPIDLYLENVLSFADLAPADERTSRAELNEHLLSVFSGRLSPNPREAYAMIENEFGKSSVIGRGIGRAKGRFRTYLKKQRRRLPIMCGISLVLALAVRMTIAQAFYAAGPGAVPLIPVGSRVLVYKLATTFAPQDVVVFRLSDGVAYLGIVKAQTPNGLIVSKHGEPDQLVPMEKVVGRVFLNTR